MAFSDSSCLTGQELAGKKKEKWGHQQYDTIDLERMADDLRWLDQTSHALPPKTKRWAMSRPIINQQFCLYILQICIPDQPKRTSRLVCGRIEIQKIIPVDHWVTHLELSKGNISLTPIEFNNLQYTYYKYDIFS